MDGLPLTFFLLSRFQILRKGNTAVCRQDDPSIDPKKNVGLESFQVVPVPD